MSADPDLTGRFDAMASDEPYPGVTRRTFTSERATVTAYAFEPRAEFPRHRHAQEQVTLVQRGTVEFTVGERAQRLTAGAWFVVPPGVEHGLRAGDDGAEIVAIIVPPRERADAYDVVEGAAAP